MFTFDKVNLGDVLVIVALSISLLMAISFSMNELSMSIASGLLGYIGGASKHMPDKKAEKEG